MKPIYQNFDGLDVAFQGACSSAFLAALDDAKGQAAETRQDALLTFGGITMHVAETGAKGGYAYRVDTGPEGATWFFSKNTKPENWNIRVSAKSAWLATKGLGRVKTEMYQFLEAVGAKVGDESISRIDYCMDFRGEDLGHDFKIIPDQFIMHSHSNRSDHYGEDDFDAEGAFDDKTVNGVSGRVTSVTVGRMPGRQVIVYDKTKEITAKRKLEWLDIWAAQGAHLTLGERVFRVEIRAGKTCLKERWGITTWADLFAKAGDMFAHTLDAVRYAEPTGDKSRYRWPDHSLWEAAKEAVGADLFEMQCGAKPGVVKAVRAEQLAQTMRAMITGLLATWGVATSAPAMAEPLADAVHSMAYEYVTDHREEFLAKMNRAGKRYVFITKEGQENASIVGDVADQGGSGGQEPDESGNGWHGGGNG